MTIASMIFSVLLPVKYPARPPDTFPIIKTNTVVVSSNANVQGRDWPINSETGTGKDTKEGPKSPVKSLFQKERIVILP